MKQQSLIYVIMELIILLFLVNAHLYFNIKNSEASIELKKSTVLTISCPLHLRVLLIQPSAKGQVRW